MQADMLSDTALADVTLLVENRRFNAHRCILAARSHFFRGLLTSGMQVETHAFFYFLFLTSGI